MNDYNASVAGHTKSSGKSGFTVVELVVSMAIIAILVAIASLQLEQWNKKYNTEREINELHSDMMNARATAVMGKRNNGIRLLTSTQYTTLNDANTNGVFDVGEISPNSKILTNRLIWNGVTVGAPIDIVFDSKGLAQSDGRINIVNTAGAIYDCVAVRATRINMGQMSGGACVEK